MKEKLNRFIINQQSAKKDDKSNILLTSKSIHSTSNLEEGSSFNENSKMITAMTNQKPEDEKKFSTLFRVNDPGFPTLFYDFNQDMSDILIYQIHDI